MPSPSDPGPHPWPEPGAFEANAHGHLTPGQRRMLLGDPPPPPYAGLVFQVLVIAGGAALWWRFGTGAGITVIMVGTNIGFVVIGMNLQHRRSRRRLRPALDHPVIEGGIGEVIGSAGGVDIRCGVDSIGLGPAAPGVPPAGWYHLYWLEYAGRPEWEPGRLLLSARALAEPPATGSDDADPGDDLDPHAAAELRARLRQVLGRTEWELGFNRAGELSPPQRAELRRRARGRVWGQSIGVIVGTSVALAMLLAAILAWTRPRPDDRDATAGGFLSAGLGLVAVWLTARAAVRLPGEVIAVGRSPRLARATGAVTATLTDGENNTWTVAVDGGLTFSVSADAARAFGTPVRYTAYYVPWKGDHILLAAEPGSLGGGEDDVGAVRGWPHADWVTANAAGRLTPAQQRRIVGEPIRWRLTQVLLSAGLVVMAASATPYIVHHFRPRQIAVDDGTELIVTVSIGAAVVVACVASILWRFAGRRRRAALLWQPRIAMATGEIVWAGGNYWIHGTPVRLRLPPGHQVLPEPGPYRFYWLTGPEPTFLSAEPLRAARSR